MRGLLVVLALQGGCADAQSSAEPRDYPALRFQAPPKQLGADAITQDWPGFLGPERGGR